MKSTPKTVQIAEPLWRALEVMSEQMGVDKDALLNQAVYALARANGFITPPQIKVNDEAAHVLDSIPDPMPSIKPGPPVPTPPEPAPTVPERDRGPLPSPPTVAPPVPAASPARALAPPPQPPAKLESGQGPSEAERNDLRAVAVEKMKAIGAEVERVVASQADAPIGASSDDDADDVAEHDESDADEEQDDEEQEEPSSQTEQPAEAQPPEPEAAAAPASEEHEEEEPHTGENEHDPKTPLHAAQMKDDLEALGLGEGEDPASDLSPLPEELREQSEGIPTALVKPREALAKANDAVIEPTALRPKMKTDDRAGIPTMGVHVNLPDRPDGAEEINVTGTVRRLGLKIAKDSDSDEPEEPQERTQIVRKERPRLFITRAGENPVEITTERYVIGRGPHCDMVIESNRVSREHAAVYDGDGGYVVEDLGSSNGTWFKEERVQKHVIEDGDEVFFGNEAVRFSVQAPGAANKRGARRDGRVQA
jgi:hypothetical protein